MLKRITSFITSLVLGTSYLLAFAPAVVKAAADTCTWTGGGDGTSFSDGANWSVCDNGAVPESGDALVFDATTVEFDGSDLDNDIAGATFAGITFVDDEENFDNPGAITGEAFSLSGDIVSTASGLTINSDITVTTDVDFGYGFINGDLDLGANTVNVSNWAYINGVVSGSGGFAVADGGNLNLKGKNTFTGDITTVSGAAVDGCGVDALGTDDGSTDIVDGASLVLGLPNKATMSEPISVAGDGPTKGKYWTPSALNVYTSDCSGSFKGGGPSEPKALKEGSATSATLSAVTLTDDIEVNIDYLFTLNLKDAELNDNKVTLSDSSKGTVIVNGKKTTYNPRNFKKVNDKDAWYTMYPGETIQLDGTIDSLTLFNNSTLSGNGTVTNGISAYPDSTVAIGNSPGCIEAGSINFSSNNFNVEIAGKKACSGYDQLKVTLSDTEDKANEDVYLFDSVLNLSFTNDDYQPAAGTKFIIIDNDGTDEVQGTFADLPEGEKFEVNGGVFSISYEGGDGNDVEITVLTAPEVPDTGFAPLNVNNPAAIMFGAIGLAGAILVVDRKHKALSRR